MPLQNTRLENFKASVHDNMDATKIEWIYFITLILIF